MALSKEFYLDEIRSKYPNSYNESLKDLPVKELEDMLDFLEGALGKADGGSIGIEVLFGPKVPAAPSQLVSESDILLGYRGDAGYRSGSAQASSIGQGNVGSKASFGGGKGIDRSGRDEGAGGAVVSPQLEAQRMRNMINQNKSNAMFDTAKGVYGIISPFIDPRSTLGKAKKVLDTYNLYKNMKDISEEDLILGIEDQPLPGSNLRTEVTDIDLKRAKEPMTKMMDYDTYKSVNPSSKITPYEFEELKKGNIKETGTFTAADGGRVGLFMGGPAWEGQALSIYDLMKAYNFTDQEIADALSARGLYTPGGTRDKTPPPPTEGIIGIDLQQRDKGDAFSPFGPLQSTFTKDLTDVDMYKGVNVEGLTPFQQMQKFKVATQDNMFGLGKIFQPKIRGTLGNRLANQPRLPLPASIASYSQSPFNPDSKNYNPDFVDQLNYLEGMEGLIGMSSVGLKYGPESVLFGKNVISGFGTNNYQKALEKFIAKAKGDRKIKAQKELDNFLNAEKARKEREAKEQLEIQRAATREADRRAGAFDDRVRLDPGGGGTFKQQTAAKERQGVQVAGPGFGKGAYFADGGLATMFTRRR